METLVESAHPGPGGASAPELRLLGGLAVRRNGAPSRLPASRKLRALLAFLALAPQPVSRGQLCALLWDVPNDPRGELRWSLSKLRGLLDADDRRRVVTAEDKVALDLAGCAVDAIAIAEAMAAGPETLDPRRLRHLARLFTGDFLAGLELDRCPEFTAWLSAQRRRFRAFLWQFWNICPLRSLMPTRRSPASKNGSSSRLSTPARMDSCSRPWRRAAVCKKAPSMWK